MTEMLLFRLTKTINGKHNGIVSQCKWNLLFPAWCGIVTEFCELGIIRHYQQWCNWMRVSNALVNSLFAVANNLLRSPMISIWWNFDLNPSEQIVTSFKFIQYNILHDLKNIVFINPKRNTWKYKLYSKFTL